MIYKKNISLNHKKLKNKFNNQINKQIQLNLLNQI